MIEDKENIEIKEVKNKKDLKKFLNFPEKIYKNNPCWVPKLDLEIKHLISEKNPFYRHACKKLFIAQKKGNTVGRIAVIVDDNYIDFQKEKAGFFGFFETENNIATASSLLKKCETFLRERGMQRIIGPMNPSSNDEIGFLLEGYEMPPRIMMPYNPPYYHRIMENCSYRKAKDLLAFNMNISENPVLRLERFVKKIKKRNPGLSCRPINMKKFKPEVGLIKEIYNSGWERNWGFVPWTDEEISDLAKNLKSLVIDELVQIAFVNNDPAGFLLALPDYNEVIKKIGRKLLPLGWFKFILNKNKIKNLRLMAMGVKRKYHGSGAAAFMYYNSLLASLKRNYRECEFSWILEDNEETKKIARMMGGKIYKKYRVYKRNLT